MRRSVWFHVSKQIKQSLTDFLWYVQYRLADIILVLLAVAAPIGFTTFYETATLKPPEPNNYCVRLVAGDGQANWGGPLCFAADFAAQWYRNVVEFPAAITADCQVVRDEREKKACADRKQWIVHHVGQAVGAGVVGFSLGSMRR